MEILTLKVKLHSLHDMEEFVKISSKYPFGIELKTGRYTVNAKSIMGAFGLELGEEITVEFPEVGVKSDNFQFEIERYATEKLPIRIIMEAEAANSISIT